MPKYGFILNSFITQELEQFDLADKMKRNFFKAAVISILLYGCARGVMVIVVGNGHGHTSSNPGPG